MPCKILDSHVKDGAQKDKTNVSIDKPVIPETKAMSNIVYTVKLN